MGALGTNGLRIVFRYFSTGLLRKGRSIIIHQRSIWLIATEIYNTKSGLSLEIVNKIFNLRNHLYT